MRLGDGRCVPVAGEGTAQLQVTSPSGKTKYMNLQDVLLVPEMLCNLLSVRVITDKKNCMEIEGDRCTIIAASGEKVTNDKRKVTYTC